MDERRFLPHLAARRSLPIALLIGALVLGPSLPGETHDLAPPRPPIQAWVFHFDGLVTEAALPTQVGVMQAAPEAARLIVAVPGARAQALATELFTEAGAPIDRIEFQQVAGPLSPWARDRYLVIDGEASSAVLVPPSGALAATWRGDAGVGHALARVVLKQPARSVAFHVEGGDLLLGHSVALVGAGTISSESRRLGRPSGEVVEMLGEAVDRRVVVVGRTLADLPHDHLDMFLALVDDGTVVLGDPRLTRSYFEAARDLGLEDPVVGELGQLTWSTQEAAAPIYAALAQELSAAGFAVRRVPILHAAGPGILTWTNVVVEGAGAAACAYVPSYALPHLDRMAERTWRGLGFRVHMIPSRDIILHGGAVRCVTNVVRGSEARDPTDR